MTLMCSDTNICGADSEIFDRLRPHVEVLRRARSDLAYGTPESLFATPFDPTTLANVEEAVARLGEALRLVLVVGIGGSDMGARAAYEALFKYRGAVDPLYVPRLLFIESVEPEILERLEAHLHQVAPSPEHLAVVVVSKSGTTTETIVNAAVIMKTLDEHYGKSARSRVVVVSNAQSPLALQAQEDGIPVYVIPEQVPGRFSVGTFSGLLPLALSGMNVRSFAEGMARGVEEATALKADNPALSHAAQLFHHATNHNMRTHDLFLFHPELETLGKWYRQLLAESVGKEHPVTRERVGITPSVVIGTTDLHSVIQLVFAGPRDRFTTFVIAPHAWAGPIVPVEGTPLRAPHTLTGKTAGEVNVAIYEGVKRAYEREGLPYCEQKLADLSAAEIGRFMAIEMASVVYLARLFDVNPFDQPAVETYKSEVRKLLHDKSA